jgi:hypothetical protein
MSHQDRKSIADRIVVNHESIQQAINSVFTAKAFRGLTVRKGSSWAPRMLVVVALLWACSLADGMKKGFQVARKVAAKMFRWMPPPGATYNGFMKQLQKWHGRLLILCLGELRLRMEQDLFGQWKIAGFVVIAGDGSRIELPRTAGNEAAYSPRRKKTHACKKGRGKAKRSRGKRWRKTKRQSPESIAKKANSPQMWLTLFWHVGTGLPWAWRTGPSDSSERQHLQEMFAELPKNTLITADAGFMGYDFWRAVIGAGHNFVIRAGANVRLLKNLGYAREYDNTIYLWPDSAAKKDLPPLVLRAVWVHDGKNPMCLITNVLSKTRLSDRQIAEIYKARWGIELFFRTFKQTFHCRKLRSHTPDHAQLEADWSLVALWAVCLLAQREIARSGGDPSRLSPAGAIQAIQEVICHYRNRPDGPEESLGWMFRNAVRDDCQRTSSKTARNYPRKRQRERTGVPKVGAASKSQRAAARQLKQTRPQFQLPA